MTSKYLKKFSQVTNADLPIRGGRILLELMPEAEQRSAGGLIISAGRKDELQAPTLGIVIAVGNGYTDEEGNDVPVELLIGTFVMVPSLAVKAYSTFPGLNDYAGGTIAMAKESDVIAAWTNVEAFEAYSKKLNGT